MTLTGMSGKVTIDCDAKTVFQGSEQAGGMVTLNDAAWPVLSVGETLISWTGNVTNVTVTPNWRWL